MSRYTLDEFVQSTTQKDRGQGLFEFENERILEANLSGRLWIKLGSMISYRGDIRFTREGILEHGVGRLLKRALTGEGARLTKAEGRGTLYLADDGKKISILNLQGETICVNGNDILAFEDTIDWDVKMIRKLAGVVAGGLFNFKLSGHGMVAISTHYDPLTLTVSGSDAVYTDPNATVAWSGSLEPDFKTDISLKTFLGRGSGESIQMCFRGDGFVVVQPKEERALQREG